MRVNKITKNSALFFLLAFLFLRIADVHTYSHFSDDDELSHCELCEMITTSNQFTPLLDGSFLEEKTQQCDSFQIIKVDFWYKTPNYCITQPETIFNKPPPSL